MFPRQLARHGSLFAICRNASARYWCCVMSPICPRPRSASCWASRAAPCPTRCRRLAVDFLCCSWIRRYVMSELLEHAAAELIASPPREAPPISELRRRIDRRRGRRTLVAGIAVALVVVAGLVAISTRPADQRVGQPGDGTGAE